MEHMKRSIRALPSHFLGILVGVLFWCLLWGGFTLLSVLGGLAISVIVYFVFPMPPMSRELTFRPVQAAIFLVVFLKDLTMSSLEVAWYALRPSGTPGSSVIAVKLRSRSDFFLSLTGALATLIPGSIVVEAQRSTGTLFFHAIGVTDEKSAERMRAAILRQEHRALMAFGSRSVLENAGIKRCAHGSELIAQSEHEERRSEWTSSS